MNIKSFMLFILLWLIYLNTMATTTATISRNINISDGLITSGAFPGTNGADWESDETFPGFQNIVNWYMTWDNNNLYIGRLGGNNAEGSLIYLRADLQNLTFTNTPQSYDNFTPNFSAMSGINFIAYIKSDYDEYRNFTNGNWSAPNTSLTPAFNTPGGGQQQSMEIAIPWNVITNGNGKPDNLRAVFYQVVPSPLFAYGESPWGTGVGTNGPNIGVNDGTSTSAPQPGGNIASNANITRWWGCYPIISGVGVNGFFAVQPNAGQDSEICSNENSFQLSGNEPSADALGTWSVVPGFPAGANPQFVNPNDRNTIVNGLTQNGIYRFVWNINYGRCPAVPDTVVLTRFQAPIASNAGSDVTLPCGIDNFVLNGNDPGPQVNFSGGLGTWTVASGAGIFTNVNSPISAVNNIGIGTNRYVWSITNGPCIPQTDTIQIFRFASPVSIAGQDREICGNSIVMEGNNPLTIQNTATGLWTQVSGPAAAGISSPNEFNTTITGLIQGSYTFKWKVTNGNCLADSSIVNINVISSPISTNAGNISLCGTFETLLSGNNPLDIASTATGQWIQTQGNSIATIADSSIFNTQISNLEGGNYQFAWIVSNLTCPAETSFVNIEVYNVPEANASDTSFCSLTFNLFANNPSQIQNTATGTWSLLSGPSQATIQNLNQFNTSVTVLTPGNYIFRWIVSNGNCSSDTAEISVTIGTGIDAIAGNDQEICNLSVASLLGNNANGVWSQVSGPSSANISNPNLNNTNISGLTPGEYVFQWKVNTQGCPSDSDRVTIKIFRDPIQFIQSGQKTVCGNVANIQSVNPSEVQNTATGVWSQVSGPSNIVFQNTNNFNTNVSNLLIGTYNLKFTITNGSCSAAENTFILIVKEPFDLVVKSIVKPEVNQSNGTVELQEPIGSTPPLIYEANGISTTNPVIEGIMAGNILITVSDAAGCKADTLLQIRNAFFVPTGISPNNDNRNDTWDIPGIEEFPKCSIQIFNQWGGLVFESKEGYQQPWDGMYNGNMLPSANYFYTIDLGDGSEVLKGKITLVR